MKEFYLKFNPPINNVFQVFNKILYITNWEGLNSYFNESIFMSILEKKEQATLHLSKIPHFSEDELVEIFIAKKSEGFFIVIFDRKDFIQAFNENLEYCSLELYPIQKSKSTVALPPKSFCSLDDSISLLLDFFYENEINYINGKVSLRQGYINQLDFPTRETLKSLEVALSAIPNEAQLLELFIQSWSSTKTKLRPKRVLYPLNDHNDSDFMHLKDSQGVSFDPVNLTEAVVTNDVTLMFDQIKVYIANNNYL